VLKKVVFIIQLTTTTSKDLLELTVHTIPLDSLLLDRCNSVLARVQSVGVRMGMHNSSLEIELVKHYAVIKSYRNVTNRKHITSVEHFRCRMHV